MSAALTAASAVAPTSTPPSHSKINVAGYDGPTTFGEMKEMATFLAGAVATIPVVYRNRPPDIMSMMLHAQSLNIPVTTAMHNLVWDESIGKGAMTAQLMGALLIRGGVIWEPTFDPTKSCTVVLHRAGWKSFTSTWRIIEAVNAGIAGSYTWQFYADDMLFARALSRGARRIGPDLVLGFGYTLDELREIRSHEEPPVDDREPAPEVAAFLARVTADTPAARIQELAKEAESKKVNLAGEYAGRGQTLGDRLRDLWMAAVGRELEAKTAAADKAMAAEPPPPVVPGATAGTAAVQVPTTMSAAVLDAPAGEGDAGCGCPNARLVAGEGHDPAVCREGKGE